MAQYYFNHAVIEEAGASIKNSNHETWVAMHRKPGNVQIPVDGQVILAPEAPNPYARKAPDAAYSLVIIAPDDMPNARLQFKIPTENVTINKALTRGVHVARGQPFFTASQNTEIGFRLLLPTVKLETALPDVVNTVFTPSEVRPSEEKTENFIGT